MCDLRAEKGAGRRERAFWRAGAPASPNTGGSRPAASGWGFTERAYDDSSATALAQVLSCKPSVTLTPSPGLSPRAVSGPGLPRGPEPERGLGLGVRRTGVKPRESLLGCSSPCPCPAALAPLAHPPSFSSFPAKMQ